MNNPFYVDIGKGVDFSQPEALMKGFAQNEMMKQNQREKEEQQAQQTEQDQAVRQQWLDAYTNGNADEMNRLGAMYPEKVKQINESVGTTNEVQIQQGVNFAKRALITTPENRQKMIVEQMQQLNQSGGNPKQMQFLNRLSQMSPEEQKNTLGQYTALHAPDVWKEWHNATTGDYAQGTGDMSGFTFDKKTGKYSLNPAVGAHLKRNAEARTSSNEPMDLKTLQSINKEFTPLLKNPNAIRNAADKLVSLGINSTAIDQLGAMFTLMKIYDPGSTFSDSERKIMQEAGGPLAEIVGYYSHLKGGGDISETKFNEMVNSAKKLSNVSANAAKKELTSILDIYGEHVPQENREKFLKRLPDTFEMSVQKQKPTQEEVRQAIAERQRRQATQQQGGGSVDLSNRMSNRSQGR